MVVLFLIYLVTLLCFPQQSIQAAGNALQAWFQRLIPTLFPFMVLSSVMIQANLIQKFCKPFENFLNNKLRLSESAFFCIVLGLLAGFPMGAKTVSECYKKGELTRQESEWLLSFCNVIGPMYVLGYVMPLTNFKHTVSVCIGLYGISILYGVILRITFFKNLFCKPNNHPTNVTNVNYLICFENAIAGSSETMLLLGGNIVFFSVWSVIPDLFNHQWSGFLAPLIEISSGLDCLSASCPLYSFLAISFGGICCLMQTKCCFRGTDLSLKQYFFHKCNLLFITLLYYLLIRKYL